MALAQQAQIATTLQSPTHPLHTHTHTQTHEHTTHGTARQHHLRVRTCRYTANILIAINPFASQPHLYTPQKIKDYFGKSLGVLPPHIFAIGDKSYRDMRNNNVSQCILCSGESGAGKTESTKYLLRCVAPYCLALLVVALPCATRRGSALLTSSWIHLPCLPCVSTAQVTLLCPLHCTPHATHCTLGTLCTYTSITVPISIATHAS